MKLLGGCSISFRSYTVDEIIDAAKTAGLDGIEWGSDVHVRPEDPVNAKEVRRKMDRAGLITLSYGTYFGLEGQDMGNFQAYLETAELLGTDTLRIWPPNKSRQKMTEVEYESYVNFAKKVAMLAKSKGKVLCLERHHSMLTESAYEARQFIADVAMDNFRMYWQPVQFVDAQTNLESAMLLADTVERIHVFHWLGEQRYPLREGLADWKKYAAVFNHKENGRATYLLEFMPDDRIESLTESVQALREITKEEKQSTIIMQRKNAAVL